MKTCIYQQTKRDGLTNKILQFLLQYIYIYIYTHTHIHTHTRLSVWLTCCHGTQTVFLLWQDSVCPLVVDHPGTAEC
jgi:hypothetical protein